MPCTDAACWKGASDVPDPMPRDPFGRLLRAAFYVLLAAVAVQLAVAIIRSIWPWLAGAAGVVVLGTVVVQVVRWRRSRW